MRILTLTEKIAHAICEMKGMKAGETLLDEYNSQWLKLDLSHIAPECSHYFVELKTGRVRHCNSIEVDTEGRG